MRLVAPLLIALALVAAGCSGGGETAEEAAPAQQSLAEEMITGELATGVGLGPLAPSCNDPGVYAADTAFTCTAITGPGDVINVHGSVNGDGHLNLATTNVITAAALPSFETEVAALLNNTVGSNLTAEAVDCGSTAIVLPGDLAMTCALIMPASGQIFDVTLTITDLEDRRFALRVADEPRNLELDPNPELAPPDQGEGAGG
ncbi:MAG: hypothetical protein AAGA59_08450 [Actinomycetota bacterium]